jgi:hypothetical protein
MAKLTDILGDAFDSNAVEPQQSFDLLPAGTYAVEITDSEIVDTKRGDGKLLKLTLDVIDPGEFVGRKLWSRLNLRNPNPEAERIGQAQLSQLCRAIGIGTLADTDELIGRLVRCKVTIRKGDEKYGDQNEVKAFEAHGTPVPAATKAAVPPPAAKPAAPAKPWQKRA